MEDKWGSWGVIIFLIILFAVFNNGFGFGFGGNREAAVSAADAERRNIIEAAETNYRVIEQGNLTRQVVETGNSALAQKIDFYAYQGLRDQLAEEQRKNLVLENQLYNDRKFGSIESQLASISCRMAKQPELSSLSVACPQGAIVNPYNYGCGCGCGTL